MSSRSDIIEYYRSECESIIGRDMTNNLFEMPKTKNYFLLLLKVANGIAIGIEADKIEKRRLKGKKEKEYYWGYEFTFPQDELLIDINNKEMMFGQITLKCNLNEKTYSTLFWINNENQRMEFNRVFIDRWGAAYSLIPCDFDDHNKMYTLPSFIHFIAGQFKKEFTDCTEPNDDLFDNGFESIYLIWIKFQRLIEIFGK